MSEQSQEQPNTEQTEETAKQETQAVQNTAQNKDLSPQDLYDVINSLPDRVIDAIRQVSGQAANPTDPAPTPNPPAAKSGSEKFAEWWTGSKS